MKFKSKTFRLFFALAIISSLFVASYFWLDYRNSRCIAACPLFVTEGHTPAIEAIVGRDHDFFLIDTGQRHALMMAEGKIKNSGTKILQKTDVIHDSRGGEFRKQVYQIPLLQMGNIVFRNTDAVEEPHAPSERELVGKCTIQNHRHVPISGGIGMELLSRYNVFFDFSHGKICFYKKNAAAAPIRKRKLVFLFESVHLLPAITLQTNLGTKKFIVDTGSTFSIIFESSDPDTSNCIPTTHIDLYLDREKKFRESFIVRERHGLDRDIDGILSINFLRYFDVFLNNDKRELVLYY